MYHTCTTCTRHGPTGLKIRPVTTHKADAHALTRYYFFDLSAAIKDRSPSRAGANRSLVAPPFALPETQNTCKIPRYLARLVPSGSSSHSCASAHNNLITTHTRTTTKYQTQQNGRPNPKPHHRPISHVENGTPRFPRETPPAAPRSAGFEEQEYSAGHQCRAVRT